MSLCGRRPAALLVCVALLALTPLVLGQMRRVSYGVGFDEEAQVEVKKCTISHVKTSAFVAGDNATLAHLMLSANLIRGPLWSGQERPGSVIYSGQNSMLDAPAATAFEPQMPWLKRPDPTHEAALKHLTDPSRDQRGSAQLREGHGPARRGREGEGKDDSEKENQVGERPGSIFDATGFPNITLTFQFADGATHQSSSVSAGIPGVQHPLSR